ncbi:unnamed protein product [Pedinophyceae sp. YPF-701]|nr:unnamed protein product [Pedinophyceae sp. YPF-701]
MSPHPVHHVFIDLDDTLYINPEVPKHVSSFIDGYIRKLGFPEERVVEIRHDYYLKHGTTLCGLVKEGVLVDYDDWHAHVHAPLEYERLISASPDLAQILRKIRAKRYVFTNADKAHASRCLGLLGFAEGLFEKVIHFEHVMEEAVKRGLAKLTCGKNGVEAVAPVVCKPHLEAFEIALAAAGLDSAEGCVFIDDSRRNILGAKKAGFTTVWVNEHAHTERPEAADFAVTSLLELPDVMPWLFTGAPSLRTMAERALAEEEAEHVAGASP